jgi:hypothetical protein
MFDLFGTNTVTNGSLQNESRQIELFQCFYETSEVVDVLLTLTYVNVN